MSSFRQLMMKKKGGGTLNATVVGNPTISNDFIVSGFSQQNSWEETNSNFLKIPNITVPSNVSWEFHTKVKFNFTDWESSDRVSYYILGQEYYFDLYLNAFYRKFQIEFGNIVGWYSPTGNMGNTILSENQWYFVKIVANYNSGFKVYISTDNLTWSQEISVSLSRTFYFYPTLSLGRLICSYVQGAENLKEFKNGQIDMTETYLIANNEIVWQGVI